MMSTEVLSYQFDDVDHRPPRRAGAAGGNSPVAARAQGLRFAACCWPRAAASWSPSRRCSTASGRASTSPTTPWRGSSRRCGACLGDSARGSRYIETVPTRGYRFIVPVTRQMGQVAPVEVPASRTRRRSPTGPGARTPASGSATIPAALAPPPPCRASTLGGRAGRAGPGRHLPGLALPGHRLRALPLSATVGEPDAAHVVGRAGRLPRVGARRPVARLRQRPGRPLRDLRARPRGRRRSAGADRRRPAQRAAGVVTGRVTHRLPLVGARRHLGDRAVRRRAHAGQPLRIAARLVAGRHAPGLPERAVHRTERGGVRDVRAVEPLGRRRRRRRTATGHAGLAPRGQPRPPDLVSRRPSSLLREPAPRHLGVLDGRPRHRGARHGCSRPAPGRST